MKIFTLVSTLLALMLASAFPAFAADKAMGPPSSYLQITLHVKAADRPKAAGVYMKYKQPFLDQIAGAKTKQLLVRDEDVQVLHGFDTIEHAKAYLSCKSRSNTAPR